MHRKTDAVPTFRSTIGITATMVMAARAALGMYWNGSVTAANAMMTKMPEKTPPSGVRTLLAALTADREKLPVMGYARKNEPIRLAVPIATISWLGYSCTKNENLLSVTRSQPTTMFDHC